MPPHALRSLVPTGCVICVRNGTWCEMKHSLTCARQQAAAAHAAYKTPARAFKHTPTETTGTRSTANMPLRYDVTHRKTPSTPIWWLANAGGDGDIAAATAAMLWPYNYHYRSLWPPCYFSLFLCLRPCRRINVHAHFVGHAVSPQNKVSLYCLPSPACHNIVPKTQSASQNALTTFPIAHANHERTTAQPLHTNTSTECLCLCESAKLN